MFHVRWGYIIIDVSLIDETYESIYSPPPFEVVCRKIKKSDTIFSAAKTFPLTRSVSAGYFTSTRQRPQKRVDRSRKTDGKRGTTEGTEKRGRHREDARGFRSNRGSENWWLGRVQKLSAAVGSGISISRYVARIATRYLFGGLARFQISAGKYGDIE